LLGFGKDRQVEQETRAFGNVGSDRQMPLKLARQAGDHLETEAVARLVDVEAVGKAYSLIGNLDLEVPLDFMCRVSIGPAWPG
jgi:hypothetical protein